MSTRHRQQRKERTAVAREFKALGRALQSERSRERLTCGDCPYADEGGCPVGDCHWEGTLAAEQALYGHEDDWDYLYALREEADATCLNCGSPVFVGEEACSPECQERINDAIDSLGTCGGCGRYGTYGKACFRMLDGQMEECGQFV